MFGRGEKNMNKGSYFYLLWDSFLTSFSAIIGGLISIFAFVSWILKPEQSISLSVCIPCVGFLVFLLLVFIKFSTNLYDIRKQKSIVLCIREPYKNVNLEGSVMALTTYVDYFTENGVVSIFHLENGFERQIALGQIINIQEDKKVQILIFNIDSAFPRDELLKNNKELLERLLVKPIVKLDYLEEIRYGK